MRAPRPRSVFRPRHPDLSTEIRRRATAPYTKPEPTPNALLIPSGSPLIARKSVRAGPARPFGAPLPLLHRPHTELVGRRKTAPASCPPPA